MKIVYFYVDIVEVASSVLAASTKFKKLEKNLN